MNKYILIDHPDGTQTKEDFFYFCKNILAYDKLDESVHKEWCDLILAPGKRKLFLFPRGTYKSTLITVSYVIWKLLQYPNERILIANAVSSSAEAFLREITGQLLRNEKLLEMYPGILDPKSSKVSSITLTTRTQVKKEPSISTIGVLGSLVSSHYSTIICDDLVNNSDRESDIIRDKKKEWYQDLLSILDPDGEIIVVGTKWARDDLYGYIENDLNKRLKAKERYHINIGSCYKEDGETPKYPTILPIEVLERLREEKGFAEFQAQYMNQIISKESQIFNEKDFEEFEYLDTHTVYDKVPKEVVVVGYCDLSLGKTKNSDYTAVATIGKSKDGNCYLMDISLQREPPDASVDRIMKIHRMFKYTKFGVESNLFQSLFVENLRKVSKEKNIYLPITNVYNRAKKELRIQSIQPLIKDGTLKIRSDWREDKAYKELMEQFCYFPMSRHDDGPDAVSGAMEMLRKSSWGDPVTAVSGITTIDTFDEMSLNKVVVTESQTFDWGSV